MLRALLWGAGGLSLLPASLLGCKSKQVPPTCYVPPPPKDAGLAKQPILVRWAELGAIWREISGYNENPGKDEEARTRSFEELKARMEGALDALPAWPELRVVFEERWSQIKALHYPPMMCYAPLPMNTPQPRRVVEEQVSALEKLVEAGSLTKEAARRAAAVLAKQAEFYVQSQRLQEAAAGSDYMEDLQALNKQYTDGKLAPSKLAKLAGERLVELTVNDLGMLAGEPTEEELPRPDAAGEAKREGGP
jgi:hypothetical protein